MKERERRHFGLRVSIEDIARLVSLDQGKTVRVLASSIPKDAEFINAYYDPAIRGLIMCFYHQSFNIIQDGWCIPIAQDTVFEFIEGENEPPYAEVELP